MKRIFGKRFLGLIALPLVVGASGAHAATLASQTCTRGTDVRVIEVVSPGEVGAACDLRYTRDAGKNISVPFNASNATSYCGQRARDLAASLSSSGFACSNVGAFDKVAAMREAVDLDAILAGGLPGGALVAAPEASANTDDHGGDIAATSLAAATEFAPSSVPTPINAGASQLAPAPIPVAAASDRGDNVLAVPPPHAAPYSGQTAADGEPVSLTPQGAVAPVTRARFSVGRVVGAAPEDPRPSTLAALEVRHADSADDQIASGTSDRLDPPVTAATADFAAGSTGRPPLEAIVATVQSQAAAWNDGNLGAFMNVFWRSPDFTFVSGSTVTKGWDDTYRRYREGYGEGGDLGRLVYADLEAKMLAEDTAAVVGRYAFTRGAASGAGAMTQVLRRFEGAWRIVQHHMVADSTPATPQVPAPEQTVTEAPAQAAQ